MSDVFKVVSGIGVLIAIYLFVYNADKTANIITALGTTGNKTILALQGR